MIMPMIIIILIIIIIIIIIIMMMIIMIMIMIIMIMMMVIMIIMIMIIMIIITMMIIIMIIIIIMGFATKELVIILVYIPISHLAVRTPPFLNKNWVGRTCFPPTGGLGRDFCEFFKLDESKCFQIAYELVFLSTYSKQISSRFVQNLIARIGT